eukprot:TRINITY_DN10060_c0_g1_i16.p1 TRINITY_DN10060_c0_g1~~TRINITY_DN10060_c0_g1_i16.p1  ORF type:complete len:377 (-),score=118.35 TRINITY_DN10060_c0_g1_i16:137-1267(-)
MEIHVPFMFLIWKLPKSLSNMRRQVMILVLLGSSGINAEYGGNYAPFESGQKSGCADVYLNEIPGGQYTNLLFQSQQLGLTDQWPKIKDTYTLANRLLGDIIKVTPSSKVVGDLAQFLVQNNLFNYDEIIDQAERLSFPSSVIEYFEGKIGIPPFGFPEPLRTKVLGKRPHLEGRPGASFPPYDFKKSLEKLTKTFGKVREEDVVSYALYPKVTEDFLKFQDTFGDVSVIPTRKFFAPLEQDEEITIRLERGKKLFVRLSAVGDSLNAKGEREVFFELNGNPRTLHVPDLEATKVIVQHEKASDDPGSVGAPMPGAVVSISVAVGDKVQVGTPLCVLSAMKMETVVTAPVDGTIRRLAIVVGESIKAGDLLCEIIG